MRLTDLQAPNYPYPHLVAMQKIRVEGKRGRLRGMFMQEMTLHFLCPYDLSKVPCGYGGNGYILRKTRGWVKKVSPVLQVWRVLWGTRSDAGNPPDPDMECSSCLTCVSVGCLNMVLVGTSDVKNL